MGACVEKLAHECGSSDGLQVFQTDEGEFNAYCFSCGTYEPDPYKDGAVPEFKPPTPEENAARVQQFVNYPVKDLVSRRLKKEYLDFYSVRMEVSQEDGQTPTAVLFPYGNEAGLCGWKFRHLEDKKRQFCIGTTKGAFPFGWRVALRSAGRKLYITEGEFDAIALYQTLCEADKGTQYEGQGHSVISVRGGAKGAAKEIGAVLSTIRRNFKEIVLVFDMDEPGREAVEAVSRIAPEVQVAELPYKDANECVMKGANKALRNAVVFKAAVPKNSRIVYGSSLTASARQKAEPGLSWPWQGMTEATRGIRRGETIYYGAGVKMGKSELVNAIAAHIIKEHRSPVHLIKPEEALNKSYKMLLGKIAGRIFHDPNIPFDEEAYDEADAIVGNLAIFQDIYQFGKWDDLKQDIIYTVTNDGVRDVMIDPITCFTNTMSASDANEHLTTIAAEFSAMAKDHNFTGHIFCHLKAPEGTPHERGGKVFSSQFAGSRAMMRSCNYMIGLEGNKDPELPLEERNVRTLQLLEDREFGASVSVPLYWDKNTGLFNEIKHHDSTSGALRG